MCGTINPLSFRLNFSGDAQGKVSAQFQSHQWLQGYTDILHGGITSALLDAAMTHCLFHHNIKALTGELKVRFIAPIPCDALLDISATIDDAIPPLYRVKAEIHHNGELMAKARAKFMEFETLESPV
ncbi:MAG: PaaI family thioesterase [Desulfuromonas sp.]|nr:PaaI family thioesterase [Desulfuromonas sp.]